ncbi:Hect ubiquitin ligase [Globisporangium polare]
MASTWQFAAIIVGTVLTLVIVCLIIRSSARAVDKYNAELQTALNPNTGDAQDGSGTTTVELRHEVAIKVASSGYVVCPNCAFENFTSVSRCTICQTKLVVKAAGAGSKAQTKV